ncbi:anchored repeat ABC transporter, substrate-binding protein [Corynebacterium sp.]|uniref:anchored repeat ABC transporter, substrate-binding protein n=1 Tax=Corynebacterium sp. TaxID=1720 RepID=UPI0026DB3D87|nr:anchored repeat ABC transporter, substrate-binding protein [Corynebacterium sp.]MDO5031483.1 anchored repeat ABC transporter, substrate-binding protein [Corynebacterium sp.]
MSAHSPLRAAAALLSASLLCSCAAEPVYGAQPAAGRLQVVATTPILGDIAKQIAGPDGEVTTLIPAGKDPHTFEPSLRTVREVAHADVALANGLLLEPPALMDTLRETYSAPVVEVADQASTSGAVLVPLVENAALDALWLGLRVRNAPVGTGSAELSLREATGPGEVAAYVVSTFGTPELIFDSARGPGSARTAVLPANAHTHVSWGFSRPGIYRLSFQATGTAAQTVTVAVGVNPPPGMHAVKEGHLDITADMGAGDIVLEDQGQRFDPATTALQVPSSTLQEIPPDPAYRFLGRPGTETYLLPQAVLGKHIHGEVDPHLWHNAKNVMAYAEVIAEELARADPSHGAAYRARAAGYTEQLRRTDDYVRAQIASIPERNRHLVTPHHGYAYLHQGYGIDIAGFVTPNASVEPSPREVIALRRTLENLDLPAVFIEPTQQAGAQTLAEAARATGTAVCPLYGDTLDETVPTYLDLMRFNADSLHRCLDPHRKNSL